MGSLVCVEPDEHFVKWLERHDWPIPVEIRSASPAEARGDLLVWNLSRHPKPLEQLLGGRPPGTVIVIWDAPPPAEKQVQALRLGAVDALAKADRVDLLVAVRRFFRQACHARTTEQMLESLIERSYSQSVLAEVLRGIPMSEHFADLYRHAVRPLWEAAGADGGQLVLAENGASYGDGPPLSDAAAWAGAAVARYEPEGDRVLARYPLVAAGEVVGALRLVVSEARRPQLEAFEPIIQSACGPIALAVSHLHHVEEARRQAIRDSLTGLVNHGHFFQQLRAEHDRAARYGQDFAVILLDLDHFKSINDTFGHQTGDRALQAVAEVLRGSLRQSDLAARYGGEEFALLLPSTQLEGAMALAERLRSAIAALKVVGPDHRPIGPITGSLGIAVYQKGDAPADTLERADCALYEAKHGGRDRVCVAGDSPSWKTAAGAAARG
jgi:diguanylate cyclase (GGDEF)-like protein